MKTLTHFLSAQASVLLVLSLVANPATAEENNLPEPAFFHNISCYTPEYARSKVVFQKVNALNIHQVAFRINNEFDMNDYLREPKSPSFLSKALHFFKNKREKETEQIKAAEETLHSSAVQENDVYDGNYDKNYTSN